MKNTHRLKSAADQAVRQRNYRRARERALTRLANAYLDEYKTLLEEEKLADEQMGKKWLDIDGNTSLTDTGRE
jgi:3-methyladenine DNA glycosylase/8-oxoguanine DNA glycosylase